MKDFIKNQFSTHIATVEKTLEVLEDDIKKVAFTLSECIFSGGKILFCGNGGSAADAQHFAAELSGRYKRERKAFAGIAITTDTSALTAIGNDYGYEYIFSRQVEALANPFDIVFGISTSGNSKNVVNALKIGRNIGCKTIGLSGRDGGVMNEVCDINLVIPSNDTARIQEAHILIIHILCDVIERDNM
ncbi:D-sedoheptulose 7-phosphate isomerase [Helicobacter cappadocius]|uniref:Phosphoheptose isomerase n=1 Tax=Helicobacter cappadocius TaxID=3063998 RepID=A0AA90Q3Y5_9HELI|nr:MULTISPECIES: D-sedoheptulose 7-phosphate isomerase [unclassified Helicobacter]MDO7253839.1 D-sedoheptulose 7-phosphate isomerase [Helicobacter sp. faydin-H75]MDP2539728.1 D-sedoheptulose 7-phosphate isomerase [Helicobacter sp. faydin-H76]